MSANVPEFMEKDAIARGDLLFVRNSTDFYKLSPQLQRLIEQTLSELQARLASTNDPIK